MLRKMRKRLGALVCRFRDHDWPTRHGAFQIPNPQTLVFCKRCGEEFYGRTLADLRAIPEHELQDHEFDYADWSED